MPVSFLKRIVLSYLIILSISLPYLNGQQDQLRGVIEKIIRNDTDLSYEKTPAFLISVIDADSTFYLGFTGADTLYLDEHSVFEIGSLSKTITASLVQTLISKKNLALDSRVNSFLLPDDQNELLDDLTVSHLLNHSSGLAKLPKMIGSFQKDAHDPYAEYSKKNLLDYLSTIEKIEMGTYLYSHINYALLEIVIEACTKMTYEEAIQTYLCEPLDMDHTSIVPRASDTIVAGYDRAGERVSPRSYKSFGASEGLKSSLADYTRFIKAHFDMTISGGNNIADLQANRITTTYDKDLKVTNAWHIIQRKKSYDVYMHTGRTSGHHAFAAFVKETKTGVIIFSNSYFGTDDLGMHILRMLNNNWKRKSS